MGVTGEAVRHDGANPGVFTIYTADPSPALAVTAHYRTSGGTWASAAMTQADVEDGQGRWTFSPVVAFPENALIEFYFRGTDTAGRPLRDGSAETPYVRQLGGPTLAEIAGTEHAPAGAQVPAGRDIVVRTTTGPRGAADRVRTYWAFDDADWVAQRMTFDGAAGSRDAWSLNLGRFAAGETLRYFIGAWEGTTVTLWDGAAGQPFEVQLVPGLALDAVVGDEAFYRGMEIRARAVTAPRFGIVRGHVSFSAGGEDWLAQSVELLRQGGGEVARWNFEDPAAPGLDATGRGNNGTAVGTPPAAVSATALEGAGALELNPSQGQWLRVTNRPDLNPTDQLSISVWFHARTLSTGRRLIQKGGDGAQYRIDLLSTGGGRFILRLGGVSQTLTLPAGTFQANRWHHVLCVYDGAALRAYADGRLVVGPQAASGAIATTALDLALGQGALTNTNATLMFDGWLDDVRLYRRALSEDEARALFDEGQGRETWETRLNELPPAQPVRWRFHLLDGQGAWHVHPPEENGAPVYLEILAPAMPGTADGIVRQVWWNIAGKPVSALTASPRYPEQPDVTERIEPYFEAPRSAGDSYGQRMFGPFYAPRSGDYVFLIAADDTAELWITVAGQRQLIASVPDLTSSRQYDKYPAQRSAAIHLDAGQAYLLDALMKENTGQDNLSVAVIFPDGSTEAPIRARRFLAPPAWARTDLDSDEDGLNDYEEWVYGTDPHRPEKLPATAEGIVRKVWRNLTGSLVADLTDSIRFPWQPDEEAAIESAFEAPRDEGELYGQWVFGRFRAPRTGDYVFFVAADDRAELWLTVNGERRRIARNPQSTSWRQWERYPEQRSEPVTLEAGQVYVIEALMKENTGTDHLSVAVRFPDGRMEGPVDARWFLTPPAEARVDLDTDADGLNDYEEWVFGTDPTRPETTPANAEGIVRKVWLNLPGAQVVDLTTSSRFPWRFDRQEAVEGSFEAPRDEADLYGQWVFGRFHASRTGDYVFMFASDERGELWITVGGVRQRIAWNPHATSWRGWSKYTEQTSQPIRLEAGQSYPLEALVKEATGSDHLSVAAVFPDGRREAPLDARWFLTPPPEARTDLDSDGDGLNDYEEWVFGRDPNHPDTTPANATGLIRRVWWNLPGKVVADLVDSPRFPWRYDEEATVEPAFELPYDVADEYGQWVFGRFYVPLGGDYVFQIAANERAELWLTAGGERRKIAAVPHGTDWREWTHYPEQRSEPMTLAGGQAYPLEVLMKEWTESDHLTVAVTLPGGRTEMPVRSRRFLIPPPDVRADLDSDNDGLNDYEEWVFESDPLNPDTSGDGVSDGQKVALGLDPLINDFDGDGLPDAWEIAHGTNPLVWDAHEDPDVDGLSNLQELALGTDPQDLDTDGDGVPDGVEALLAFTNPLAVEFDGTRETLTSAAGAAATVVAGLWEATPDGAITARTRNGTLDYTLAIPADGYLVLAVTVAEQVDRSTASRFDLSLAVDGVFAGRLSLPVPPGGNAEALFFLPRLAAGQHVFRLAWLNQLSGTALIVRSVALVSFGGVDADGNGVADWLDSRRALAFEADPLPESTVSPACVEGESPYPEWLEATTSAAPEETFVVVSGVGNRWYVDLPLKPRGATTVTLRDGYTGAENSMKVEWTETNILVEREAPVVIRKGDALLLTARPVDVNGNGGHVAIAIDGEPAYETMASQPVPHVFDVPGDYLVSARWTRGNQGRGQGGGNGNAPPNEMEGAITVRVVEATFNGSPICAVGMTRPWTNPGLPEEAVLEHNPDLLLTEAPIETGGRLLTLRVYDTVRRRILARLGEGGPVLARAEVVAVRGQVDPVFEVLGTLPDGSRIVRVTVSLNEVPAGLRLHLHIFADGNTFPDGTRDMYLTAADFDEHGIARYEIIIAPDVENTACHWIAFYDDATGDSIGGLR